MDVVIRGLFCFGMIFPVVSLFSGLWSFIEFVYFKKRSSAVFIPFIGPVSLTLAVLLSRSSLLLIPIAWICDLGTVAFLVASPRILSDWWSTCSFTRILTLQGNWQNQTCTLSFHRTGRYLLRKAWTRGPNETGIVGLGELGSYVERDTTFYMKSDFGLDRVLTRQPDGVWVAAEVLEGPDGAKTDRLPPGSIRGWQMRELRR